MINNLLLQTIILYNFSKLSCIKKIYMTRFSNIAGKSSSKFAVSC